MLPDSTSCMNEHIPATAANVLVPECFRTLVTGKCDSH